MINASENSWFKKAVFIALFDISESHYNKEYHTKLQPQALKKSGRTVLVHGPTMLNIWLTEKLGKIRPTTPSGDSMLEGSDSPWLEEYRKQKARTAKVQADEMERMVVRISIIEPLLMQAAALIRSVHEKIERQYGLEPAKMIAEAVDEAIALIRKAFEDVTGISTSRESDSGVQSEPPAVNAGVCGN